MPILKETPIQSKPPVVPQLACFKEDTCRGRRYPQRGAFRPAARFACGPISPTVAAWGFKQTAGEAQLAARIAQGFHQAVFPGVEGEGTRFRLDVSDRHGIRDLTAPKGRASAYRDFQLLNPWPSTSVASQMETKAFGSFSLRKALS